MRDLISSVLMDPVRIPFAVVWRVLEMVFIRLLRALSGNWGRPAPAALDIRRRRIRRGTSAPTSG
ncbi:hypothetical protein GS536_23980 [Rhodococcus hoagii]|nr:hypothetical protein [Prescottella equi]